MGDPGTAAVGGHRDRGLSRSWQAGTDTPARLDQFLHHQLPDSSRAQLQAQVRAGAVRINEVAVTRPGTLLRPGDRVSMAPAVARPVAAGVTAEAIPLHLLHEDDDVVVLDKPAGLVVHPGAGNREGTLVAALLHRYGRLAAGGGSERPGIVHRLDRTTSGVMVVARTDAAHAQLSRQFQQREVEKTYLALAQGIPKTAEGEIRLPIGRDLRQRVRMTTRRPEAHARAAHTSYRVVETFPAPPGTPAAERARQSFSLLELALHTGRTHQIRVHLSALGHPVIGDRLYGAAAVLAGPGELAGWEPSRVMLHASALAFTHPRTGARMRFTAPLPPEMESLRLRLRNSVRV